VNKGNSKPNHPTNHHTMNLPGKLALLLVVLDIYRTHKGEEFIVYGFTSSPSSVLKSTSFTTRQPQTSFVIVTNGHEATFSTSALFAKKKKKNAASTATLDLDMFDDEEPMSKKDQAKLAKQQQKQNKKMQKDAASDDDDDDSGEQAPKLSMKEKKANEEKAQKKSNAKAAALEMLDALNESGDMDVLDAPMSKKEMKAAAKAEAKKLAKEEARLEKKAKKQEAAAEEEVSAELDPMEAEEVKPKKEKVTLEERIRKERPPPKIRVMEGVQPGYVSLRLEDVSIIFRNQEVLKGVTWGCSTGDRVGLVGANGGGKTTQIRILAGEIEPTAGDVVKSSKDLRVSVLRQEFVEELDPERSLKEEFLSVFEEENALLAELRAAEAELENLDGSDTDAMQTCLDRMADVQAKADAKDCYSLESRVEKVMDLMGFTADERDDPVAVFSGGWKMRIGLGKVLCKDPNVLLLDEPTNHLDLESVEWLENFLRNQNIPMIIVSHDREFLDQVCTKIVDTEGGVAHEYDGNYSRFLQLKQARLGAWQSSYDAQEKKIKEERAWINKFRVKQPVAVKQKQAQLDKLTKSDKYVQKPPFVGKPLKFRFPDAPRLSPEVADIKGLSHSYGGGINRLLEDVELYVEKGDRIAVVGPNGSGKSTLLRLLMGKETPDEGSAAIVGQNIVANYFEQNQADVLDLDLTVSETIQGASNGQSYNELRALMGQFLFKGDAVEKKIRNLSGGEKARVSLCCMMLRPANLLILDEPTNHLDIPAKEMLEEALQHFAGSLIIVSHDRFFISRVATTIVAIEAKKITKYAGDYKFYLEKSKALKEKIEGRYVPGVQKIHAAPVVDLEELLVPKKNFGGAKTAGLVTRKDKGIKNAKRNS